MNLNLYIIYAMFKLHANELKCCFINMPNEKKQQLSFSRANCPQTFKLFCSYCNYTVIFNAATYLFHLGCVCLYLLRALCCYNVNVPAVGRIKDFCFCTSCCCAEHKKAAAQKQHIHFAHWSPACISFKLLLPCCYCCYSTWLSVTLCFLCVAARPLRYRGASPTRTPGVDHLPAWHKMPRRRWQRTRSQTEKMWHCFKDFTETLGLHTGTE